VASGEFGAGGADDGPEKTTVASTGSTIAPNPIRPARRGQRRGAVAAGRRRAVGLRAGAGFRAGRVAARVREAGEV
jgi:hypothetical protein